MPCNVWNVENIFLIDPRINFGWRDVWFDWHRTGNNFILLMFYSMAWHSGTHSIPFHSSGVVQQQITHPRTKISRYLFIYLFIQFSLHSFVYWTRIMCQRILVLCAIPHGQHKSNTPSNSSFGHQFELIKHQIWAFRTNAKKRKWRTTKCVRSSAKSSKPSYCENAARNVQRTQYQL